MPFLFIYIQELTFFFLLAGQGQLGETKLMVIIMINKIGTAILNLGLSL